MKIRHVRAIAVFGIAVVALTGARGSSGGGCSGGSSSSSSGSHSDSDSGTSGSSTTGGSVTGGSSNKAARDIRIDECEYDEARGFVAGVTATNSGMVDYSYSFTVVFTDSTGGTLSTTSASIPGVAAGSSDTTEAVAPDTTGEGDAGGGECKVTDVIRTSA